MITSFFRRFLAVGLVLVTVASAAGAEPAIIAKARARLAPDAVLDAVRTLHYVGTLEVPDPADPTKSQTADLEIFLEKPDRQRIQIRNQDALEVKVLDGYDAWTRISNVKDPNRWQQTLLAADQIKQLRADVWQNLYFFRGIESVGGRIEEHGPATIEGVECEKLSFVHSDQIVYDRYFEIATGRLVYTGNDRNNIREEGEIVAGGIRFPKQIFITIQAPDGQALRQRITFTKITVNEPLSPDLFEMPVARAQ
ncbi:MAG: hypothetical protein NVV63_07535 [Opitutus sp.]|mgnify:CR=1 FL=1|nr:hypothetical protein [Opitutus sp.]